MMHRAPRIVYRHAPYNLLQLFSFPLLFEFTRSSFRSSQVFVITAVIVMNIFIRLDATVIGVGSSPRTVGRRWSAITLIDFSMTLRLRRRWLLLRFRLVSFEAELASGKCAASWLCHGGEMRDIYGRRGRRARCWGLRFWSWRWWRGRSVPAKIDPWIIPPK